MTSYIAACIDRSRTILSLLAVVISAGLMAYIGIPVESDPDVSVPIIVVTIPHEGHFPRGCRAPAGAAHGAGDQDHHRG